MAQAPASPAPAPISRKRFAPFAACGLILLGGLWPFRVAAASASEARNAPLRLFEAKNFALGLPSTRTDGIFARLEARAIQRRKTAVRGGGLAVSSPGYGVVGLKLRFFAVPCSMDDWNGLLEILAGLSQNGSALTGGLLLTLPDGRAFVCTRPPEIDNGRILLDRDRRQSAAPRRRIAILRDREGLVVFAPE